jgi:hypothetical protein
LTTTTILAEEARILEWAEHAQRRGGVDDPAAVRRAMVELSVGQAQCAAAVAGTRALVVVVGPAGTGKTTALAPAVAYLDEMNVAVFAVAPSAVAAQVLASETGVRADTIDKFLFEYRHGDGPRPGFVLPAGGVLLVDEAGMASTSQLAEIAALAQDQRWRVRLVGDPLQFSAVGRGGMFAMLTDTVEVIELDRVHRFEQVWERDASLRLRRGDPDVAKVYAANGRISGGTSEEMTAAIIDAWWQARSDGGEVAMMAATNDTVDVLNRLAQHRRITSGELDVDTGRLCGGRWLCVGDEIVTRVNDRDLRTDREVMVKNRDRFTITSFDSHGFTGGGVTASGRSGTVTLPRDYVDGFVELGYAQTGHGSQGRTVDTALLLIDGPVDVRGVYVPMTRGRDANIAFVACADDRDPVDVFAEAITRDWIDQPAHVRHQELNPTTDPRLLSPSSLVELLGREDQLASQIWKLDRTLDEVPRRLDIAVIKRDETLQSRDQVANRVERWETELAGLDRFGHRHHNRHEISELRRDISQAGRHVDRYDTQIGELDATIMQCRAEVEALTEPRTARDACRVELDGVSRKLERDIERRAIQHRESPTVTAEIGPRPRDEIGAGRWDRAAGLTAQHDAAFGRTPSGGYLEGEHQRQVTDAVRSVDHVREIERAKERERGIDRGYGIDR